MKHMVYSPQPNATPDEVMQVLKVFTVASLPDTVDKEQVMLNVYETLPDTAKRHFRIIETK